MKEIGEALKEARENIGITKEEVASDLKLRPKQIENIESGNIEAFKDLFYLKQYIKDYSKYLGLTSEDMIDEFNEYIFDYTSKISLTDIKNAQKKIEKKSKKKKDDVISPYTIEKREKPDLTIIILVVSLLILFTTITMIVYNTNKNNQEPVEESILE